MNERARLLESIATTVADYRSGELEAPTPEHVNMWIRQFAKDVQLPLLRELDHILESTYFTRKFVSKWLGNLVTNEKIAGTDPEKFWRSANLLEIQEDGDSQRAMLSLFGKSLRKRYKLRRKDCGSANGPFIYLDDALFTGSRVGDDLSDWIKSDAPQKAQVHIVVIVTHTFGEWKSLDRLKKDANSEGKDIEFHCWRAVSFENRKAYRNISEILWPAVLPDDARLNAYIAEERKFPFDSRTPGGKLKHDIFSSEDGRQLLERELLLAGLKIRSFSQDPSPAIRPLGFSPFGLGFGAMIVTYRNCPNNFPLAFWWGDPEADPSSPLSKWYPLFPRKTYSTEVSLDDIRF